MKRPHLLRRLSTLRPRSGRKLPKQYRVRNVDLLAFKATKGVRDPAFAELLSEIDDGAPLHTGHQVELFFRGDQAFDAMCDAIAGARREILLESYTLKSDRTGRRIYGGLREASLRGVTVRVIADAVGSFETDEEFWEQIRDSDVDFQLYHPLLGKIWKTLYRDHRKILVVDREVAFTGGMNIADEYGYGDEDGDAWRDTHVRARGSVAQEMAGVFLEGWLRAGGEPFELGEWEERARDEETEAGEARLLVLDARPRRGHLEAAAILAAITGAARDFVWISNAYFAPGRAAVDVLGRAAARGVDVRLLLQKRTDAPLVRHAGHGWFSELISRGVRIYEYQGPMLHAKTLVADGYASVVGSTNLDFRSFHFNAECNLVILDEDSGSRIATAFRRDLGQAREIELGPWRSRPWLHRLGDRVCRWLSPVL